MRRRNMRVVITGSVLVALAVVFFLFFASIASKSTNPAELMRTVGATSGVAIGVGVAMVIFGWIGKEA